MDNTENRLFLLPLRRRLAVVVLAWLGGICAAQVYSPALGLAVVCCALCFAAAYIRCRRRQSALFCAALCMVVAGNAAAGHILAIRDEPTPPQTPICGTVSEIESDFRVVLRDVVTQGSASPARPVVVTLMLEKEETRSPVKVGQRISGTGRLFAPEEARNPGGIDRRIRAIADGYELSGYILPGWTAEGDAVFSLKAWFRSLRLRLIAVIEKVFGEQAAIFQGILLGSRDLMDDELVSAMQMTGTVHILTVSGLHMGMMAGLVALMLRRLPLGRYVNLLVQTGMLLFFSMLTGGAAGTQRALIMATMRALAVCRGRRYEPLTALAVAALLMTVINPLLALNASFQFSFFVVFGIQTIGKNIDLMFSGKNRTRDRLPALLRTLSMAISAQIASMPMNLMYYGYVPLLSLPMNMFCSFLLPVMMIGGWAAVLLHVINPAWATAASMLPGQAAALFAQMSLKAGTLRYAIVRLPSLHVMNVLMLLALMLLVSKRLRFGGRRGAAVIAAAACMALMYLPRLNPAARYVQIDVGQGDGAVLRSGRHAVLVDIGPMDSYDTLRYLRSEGLMLDAVLLSHLDEDHAGAIVPLLRSEIELPCIVIGDGALAEDTKPEIVDALATAYENGTQIRVVSTGDEIVLPWMTAQVYIPDETHQGSNERSMLLRVNMAGRSILTGGDLPIESEPDAVPKSDILKVAHHGSRYATSEAFLAMARPEVALISVGATNNYGHPTRRVLDALDAVGAKVYRTDVSGCVTVWLEEDALRVDTWKKQEEEA